MRLLKKVLCRAILTSLCGLAPLTASAEEAPAEWPIAIKDIATTSDNQPITISVLENDIGAGLTLTSVNAWSTNGGQITINPDNQTVSYTKLGTPDTWPESDSFWYVFTDAIGRTNAGKVEVILGEPVSQGWPQSVADSANTTINTPIKIDVLSNDTGLGLTIKSVNTSSVGWGRITIQGDELYYTPYTGYTGTDEFWYVMTNVLGQTNAAKVTVNVTEPSEVIIGQLNDTGTVLCGDFPEGEVVEHNNDLTSCSGADAQGDIIPPNQDALSGRDVTDNDDSDGHSGFSFTKLSATGESLASTATTWSCVKDNVTGLIWENKAGQSAGFGAAGLHSADDEYTYYNTDFSENGGVTPGSLRHASFPNRCFGYVDGQPETYCNTEAYTNRVNAESYCGISNWELPSPSDLQSIINYDGSVPTIDSDYFPNTAYSLYATSAISVRSSGFSLDNYIKAVAFYDGHTPLHPKFSLSSIRLVSKPLSSLGINVVNLPQ